MSKILQEFKLWLEKEGWDLEANELRWDMRKCHLSNCTLEGFLNHLKQYHALYYVGYNFFKERIDEYVELQIGGPTNE